ncbi:all trans-polyprenyl-diphosphate synthase PDSS2-like [Uloborus diversus]|uniref:all trans-polyprenyl-diphosphate synthase PDSS2-like n=1 Tax=Uloborus diversus TaxID=327109 RepID=UPI00240A4EA5|nr:all trans-polyprenyl-diphosphate synthase PDSS2-like [Uloborus diversus]
MLSKTPVLVYDVCLKLFSKTPRLRQTLMHRNINSQISAASVPTQKWSPAAKTHDWNRAVSDAEKIVGYPTSYFSLKCLLSDEFTNIAMHLRKLVGTNHPILKTAKRLVYHGRTNMQTRGLIVLLLSKAAGHAATCSDISSVGASGVTGRQQTLAEITEMIHTAHLIHKGILNLSTTAVPDQDVLQDLQFGNKISILSGDYLLANACKGLANLRNCKVVDLISQAIGDFMQAEFLGEHDKQGNPIPITEMSIATWEEKHLLSAGSLLANSCKAALELAGHDETLQEKGFEFGKNVALAWQVYSDLQPFVDSLNFSPGNPFDLSSLPVVFYLERNPQKINAIRSEIGDDISNLDFKNLYDAITDDDAVERTKQMLHQYSQNAEDLLQVFEPSAATKALSNIINSLRE